MDFCTDCTRLSGVVEDYATGDKICSECGLVLEEMIVFDAERMLSDDDLNNVPVASEVAAMIQVDLDDEISRLIDSLGDSCGSKLNNFLKYSAKDIYSNMKVIGGYQGRDPAKFAAACLYLACKVDEAHRTLREISAACIGDGGATDNDIAQESKFILDQFKDAGEPMVPGFTKASRLMGRFCAKLGMRQGVTRAAREVVHNSEELNLRRLPASIAGAAIYMVTQLSDEKKLLKELVTGAAERTIQSVYRDMYPSAARIIPRWFKTDVSALRKPHNLAT